MSTILKPADLVAASAALNHNQAQAQAAAVFGLGSTLPPLGQKTLQSTPATVTDFLFSTKNITIGPNSFSTSSSLPGKSIKQVGTTFPWIASFSTGPSTDEWIYEPDSAVRPI